MIAIVVLDIFFFFFKQKTAYEMRISDWSSDVCSSDLAGRCVIRRRHRYMPARQSRAIHWMHSDASPKYTQRSMPGPGPGASASNNARPSPANITLITPGACHSTSSGLAGVEIGRASCRERECQYV